MFCITGFLVLLQRLKWIQLLRFASSFYSILNIYDGRTILMEELYQNVTVNKMSGGFNSKYVVLIKLCVYPTQKEKLVM